MRRTSSKPFLGFAMLIVAVGLLAAVISHPARAMMVLQQATGTPTGTGTALPGTTTPTGTSTSVPLAAYPAFPAAPSKATRTVIAESMNGSFAFAPKTLHITIGTKVIWKNSSQAPHTVTGKGSWSSFNKRLPVGKSVSYTFKKAGTYHYYCIIHPYMVGTITVK